MRNLAVATVLAFCVVYTVAVTIAAAANTVINRNAGPVGPTIIAEGKTL